MSTTDIEGILQGLVESNGGTITPQLVLDFARPEDSPLHSHFEWDDTKAAERYRLRQASSLIVRVKVEKVISPTQIIKVRAYLPVKQDDRGEAVTGYYKPIDDLSERDIGEIRMQMERDLALLRRKYRLYNAVFDEMLAEQTSKSA